MTDPAGEECDDRARLRGAGSRCCRPVRVGVLMLLTVMIVRSVDEVRYSKTFAGAEVARIATRIDAGESLYHDDGRSYWISYRPLLEWPES